MTNESISELNQSLLSFRLNKEEEKHRSYSSDLEENKAAQLGTIQIEEKKNEELSQSMHKRMNSEKLSPKQDVILNAIQLKITNLLSQSPEIN